MITDLPDDRHEHVDLPAAGVQGGGVPYKQHVAPRLFRCQEGALRDEELQVSYKKYSATLQLR